MENLVNIGTVVGTHHLLGTVKVSSIFDEIDVILGEKVLLEKEDKKRVLTVKKVKRLNDKKILIDFEEIINIDQAKEINSYKVNIRRDLLPERNENEFYFSDLLGMDVFDNEEKIGSVADVMETMAHNILVIQDNGSNEILVPMIEQFVNKIDFENNKILVTLIEGMR